MVGEEDDLQWVMVVGWFRWEFVLNMLVALQDLLTNGERGN